MNILITGGTGFIGSKLTEEFLKDGHNVIITTRRGKDIWYEDRGVLRWQPPSLIPSDIISRIDAVINLAGEPIAKGRWTEDKKDRILRSRVDTTRAIVQSIRNVDNPPKVLLSASAIGYYGPHGDEYVTEETPPGNDFLSGVCKAWESEALMVEDAGTRVTLLRIGLVLDANGGLLQRMIMPFRLFVGGYIGSGRQWFSWIHIDDVIGVIRFLLEHDISGPVNLTAPNPVINRDFSKALGRALHRPSWFHVPSFAVRLALGEFGRVVLTGQRVIPEKLLRAGYGFKYPEIDEALKALF